MAEQCVPEVCHHQHEPLSFEWSSTGPAHSHLRIRGSMMSTPLPRRVGLSRRQRTSPLLSRIGGRDQTQDSLADSQVGPRSTRAAANAKAEITKMASKTKASNSKEPVADDAPPMSTDDEDENEGGQANQGSSESLEDRPPTDSSGDERGGRGDIKRTSFGSAGAASSNGRQTRPAAGSESRQPRQAKKSNGSIGSRQKRKLSADESGLDKDENAEVSSKPRSGSADHFTTALGFTKRKDSRAKYKATKRSRASSEVTIHRDDEVNKNTRVRTTFLAVPDLTPVKREYSFKPVPAENSPLNVKSKAEGFIFPSDDGLEKAPGRPKKQIKILDDELPSGGEEVTQSKKPKGKRPMIRAPGRKLGPAAAKRSARSKKKADANESDDEESPLSPPARIFEVPPPLPQHASPSTDVPGTWDNSDSDSDALSPAPSIISNVSLESLNGSGALVLPEVPQPTTTTTLCPWCRAPVEKSQLEEFAQGRRLNVRMQSRFCQSHKKETALETWKDRKYPEVDWQTLEGRFSQHRDRLLGIINGEESHYRAKLASRIELGQARDMKREENLNPGYYGPRGFNVMCDYLVGEFAGLLKEKAVADKVIAGRGSAAFIQSVLVAELAVQLICEDMGVSVEAARGVMEESKAVGEMVHEEV